RLDPGAKRPAGGTAFFVSLAAAPLRRGGTSGSEDRRESSGSDFRSRQQRRPSPQGAEEEDAARGLVPRNEAPRALREAVGKARPPEGRGRPPGPQAGPQARPARTPDRGAEEAVALKPDQGRYETRRAARATARPFFVMGTFTVTARCSVARWAVSLA